jgi:flagellar protein FlgJ
MDNKNLFFGSIPAHFRLPDQHLQFGATFRTAKNFTAGDSNPQIRDVCREMESLFINYLFKEMRATIDKSGFISGGRAEEIFTSLQDVELARKISAAGGIGLSKILLQQLGDRKIRRKDSGLQ